MTLLFDQNISARITKILQTEFPDCAQVTQVGLSNASDLSIWLAAKKNNQCIVTFDSDFLDILTLKGFPPKIILLRFGNKRTAEIAGILKVRKDSINTFMSDLEIGALEILT